MLKVGAKKKCSVEQVVEAYQRLQDINLVAEALEVSHHTVRSRLKESKTPLVHRNKPQPHAKIDPQQVIELRDQKLSLRAISTKLGVSHQAIARCLKVADNQAIHDT